MPGPARESARLLIHVRRGTGRERSGLSPCRTGRWPGVRQSWVTPRHPVVIFPAAGRGGLSRSTATAPRPRRRVQGAFREARQERGIHQHASVHTRRPAWATQVLAAGVNLRRMQVDLGHHSPTPTSALDTPDGQS